MWVKVRYDIWLCEVNPSFFRAVGGVLFDFRESSSLNQCNSATLIGDPRNNFETRNRVMIDVDYAFRGDRPHLIDEWQGVPSLWDATRFNVDKYNEKGIYVLTGSSTPVYKGIYHSGAGRIGRMRMRTMSLYESGDSDGAVTLSSIFDGTVSGTDPKEVSLERLIYLTVRGRGGGTRPLPVQSFLLPILLRASWIWSTGLVTAILMYPSSPPNPVPGVTMTPLSIISWVNSMEVLPQSNHT